MIMSDTITVQLSVSVDTLLTIIGGAMIVVTVVVISVVGKIVKLINNLICQFQEMFPPFSSFVCQALMCSSFGLYQDSRPAPATYPEPVQDNCCASLGKRERPEIQLQGGEAAEVPGGGS